MVYIVYSGIQPQILHPRNEANVPAIFQFHSPHLRISSGPTLPPPTEALTFPLPNGPLATPSPPRFGHPTWCKLPATVVDALRHLPPSAAGRRPEVPRVGLRVEPFRAVPEASGRRARNVHAGPGYHAVAQVVCGCPESRGGGVQGGGRSDDWQGG